MRLWKKSSPTREVRNETERPIVSLTWESVYEAGQRCVADMALIDQVTLLDESEKESLKNDARDMFFHVFQQYIRR